MSKTKFITLTAVFCALGALLPQAFHIFGETAGKVFLPMHIPAMLAGLIVSPVSGLVCGLLSPILSFLITGGAMPILIKVPFMMLEVGAYGLFCGLFSQKVFSKARIADIIINIASVFIAQIAGRIVNAAGVLAAVHILGVTHKGVSLGAVYTSVIAGLPGIVIQLLLVPVLAVLLKKAVSDDFLQHNGK